MGSLSVAAAAKAGV